MTFYACRSSCQSLTRSEQPIPPTLGKRLLFGISCACSLIIAVSCGRQGKNAEQPSGEAVGNEQSDSEQKPFHPSQNTSRVSAPEGQAIQGPVGDAPTPKPEEPKLTPQKFLTALHGAVGKGDPGEIRALLEKASQVAGAADAIKLLLVDPSSSSAMRRYAAEALVRLGTAESVQAVFNEILIAHRKGDADAARALLPALEAPTSSTGYQSMFDFLLGRGEFAQSHEARPEELIAAVRKTLRVASDRETVGTLATRLYLDPQVSANNAALVELFDGVAHPVMLAQLAAHAYQENSPQNAAQFLDRLRQHDDQGVVQALVQMTSNEAVPLNDAATALYNWSLQHPSQALPGLFVQYITDASQPAAQRSVAAFGLAGSANSDEARRFLEKAISSEGNTPFRTNLQLALATLSNRPPSSDGNTKP